MTPRTMRVWAVRRPGPRVLAAELGAASVGGPTDAPPEPLDAAIIFAPTGELVPLALQALDDAGTVVCAGIHMSDIPALDYTRHLFGERQLRSVTGIPARTHATSWRRRPASTLRCGPPSIRSRTPTAPSRILRRTGSTGSRSWTSRPKEDHDAHTNDRCRGRRLRG